MTLPFTLEQFLQVFVAWNTAIWPTQIVIALLGAIAVALLLRPGYGADRVISGLLALFWAVNAIGYHWLFFSVINRAALLFGALFLLQALLLVTEGVVRGRLRFEINADIRGFVAIAMIAYAMLVYPLIGLLLTQPYPETPLFGVAPCPTTIFTFGLLLLARHPTPWLLAVIPLVWGVIGGSAAFILGVPQDYGLPIAALAWLALQYRGRRRSEAGRGAGAIRR